MSHKYGQWKAGVDGLARLQSVPVSDKNDACMQAWERYAVIALYPTDRVYSAGDFTAGFNAGYAAGLQSTPVEPPIAKSQKDRATVQSELERR